MKKLKETFQSRMNLGETNVRHRARYLVQAISLEENQSVYQSGLAISLISGLFFFLLIWSAFTYMPEIANAEGEVVPFGRLHKVQHLDGGIVKNIFIRNGDVVEKGSTLLILDDAKARSDLERIDASRIDLLLRIERINALLEERAPDFSFPGKNYANLVNTHFDLYNEQINNDNERKNSIIKKIQHRKAELRSKDNQISALKDELDIFQQQYDMREKLFKKGQVAKIDMLDTSAQLASARNRLAETQGEMERLANQISELEQEIKEYVLQRRESLNAEKSETVRQYEMTQKQIVEFQERIERLVITAQIRGIVQGLKTNSINSVVAPGELLLELVPIGDELLVEAKLKPEDVGHVEINQPVTVKVSSYDHQKFGTLAGKIKGVSASTYIDHNNIPYFLAEIKLDKNHVGHEREGNVILPGMTVQADIITGEKSILEYLLKPLRRGLDTAFSER